MNDALYDLDQFFTDPKFILVFSIIFLTALLSFVVRRVFHVLRNKQRKRLTFGMMHLSRQLKNLLVGWSGSLELRGRSRLWQRAQVPTSKN